MFQQTLAHLNLEISTPDLWRKEFPYHAISAANRLVGEVVQSRRRPLLGSVTQLSLGTGALRHYANQTVRPL